MRLEYWKIAPESIKALAGVSAYLDHASIDVALRAFVELRVSQINGCAYCVDIHADQPRNAGQSTQRIDCVAAWREAHGVYTDRERAAVAWAESVTHIGSAPLGRGPGVPDAVYDEARRHFSEKEIVDRNMIVAVMNAWNRIAVPYGRGPARRAGG